jgi:hypothetical protein
MILYLISQTANTGYDTYDSAVVAAETPDEAIRIHPSGGMTWDEKREGWAWGGTAAYDGAWTRPDLVSCRQIGIADPGTGPGVICASFNAG